MSAVLASSPLKGRNVSTGLKQHRPIIGPVFKAVEISHDDRREEFNLTGLGHGPIPQIVSDLADFVFDHTAPRWPIRSQIILDKGMARCCR
jgi:hypothetical protein